MRNVPTYIRPRSPEILKVSLRNVGLVSILRHTSVARYPLLRIYPRFDIKGIVVVSMEFMIFEIPLILIERRNSGVQILKFHNHENRNCTRAYCIFILGSAIIISVIKLSRIYSRILFIDNNLLILLIQNYHNNF